MNQPRPRGPLTAAGGQFLRRPGRLRTLLRSDRFLLFGYFGLVILLGTMLLRLPAAWEGPSRLRIVDALFTATSAACVTGLIAVDTASFSLFGQLVILALIQLGGFGIISFTTLYLAIPAMRMSLQHQQSVRQFYVGSVEVSPRKIIRQIVLVAFGIEVLGATALYIGFGQPGLAGVFNAVFHAVSAFCNAGFSLFSNGLRGAVETPVVSVTIVFLVVLGGVGFVVLLDIGRTLGRRKLRLSFHSKVVLIATVGLILAGSALFLVLEWDHAYAQLAGPDRVVAAVFQSVTLRTAGFDTVDQSVLRPVSQAISLPLMLVGGAPGSFAGGIKVTTALLVMSIVLKGGDRRGSLRLFRARVPADRLLEAMQFTLKALVILFCSATALTLIQLPSAPSGSQSVFELAYETVSAFGTVGLSLGATAGLTLGGKLVVIATMVAGRLGLVALALPVPRRVPRNLVSYPTGEVLLG